MKTVVIERGGLREKWDAAAQPHGLRAEDVVAERRGLSARERLAVYTSGRASLQREVRGSESIDVVHVMQERRESLSRIPFRDLPYSLERG